jgi:hypothetical protein
MLAMVINLIPRPLVYRVRLVPPLTEEAIAATLAMNPESRIERQGTELIIHPNDNAYVKLRSEHPLHYTPGSIRLLHNFPNSGEAI